MPAYGTPLRSGLVLSIAPGDNAVLFDGTETPALNLASIAFSRATGQSAGPPAGMTFNVNNMPVGMTIDVQVSGGPENGTGTDGAVYNSVYTMTPTSPFYTDVGYSPFYRLMISAYVSGAMPICSVQR